MHIDGGCHCGYITYEAQIDPAVVTICHCTDCQVLTGTAFRWTVQAAKENFKLLGGEPKVYVKTAESGNKRVQAFCPQCGTPIYTTAAVEPRVYGIRAGTVRQHDQLRPTRQIWCRSAQPWAMQVGSILPQAAKQS